MGEWLGGGRKGERERVTPLYHRRGRERDETLASTPHSPTHEGEEKKGERER